MLADEVRSLEDELLKKQKRIEWLEQEIKILKERIKKYHHLCEMMIPNQVYTHKQRRNTTVKFLDGSQQTVTRIKGEKDCIETAIAYCVLKQLLTTEDLRKLVENKEEH